MDERLVAVEEPVTAREQVPLEPALAEMLGEDLHHPAVRGEMLVERPRFRDPGAIGDSEDIAEPVRSGFVWAEEPEVVPVAVDDVAQEPAENASRLARRCRRLRHLDGVVAKIRKHEVAQQDAAVRMRIGAHPAIACGSLRGQLGY